MKKIIVPKGCAPKACYTCPYCFENERKESVCVVINRHLTDGEYRILKPANCPVQEIGGLILEPQMRKVYDYMIFNGSITSPQAIDHLHITRLASVIHKLRNKAGMHIVTDMFRHVNADGETTWLARYFFEAERTE